MCTQDQWLWIDTDLPGKEWLISSFPPLSNSVTSPRVLPLVPAEDVGPLKSTREAMSALWIDLSVLIWQINKVSLPGFTSCKTEANKCLPADVMLDIQVMKLVHILNKGSNKLSQLGCIWDVYDPTPFHHMQWNLEEFSWQGRRIWKEKHRTAFLVCHMLWLKSKLNKYELE